MVTMDRRAGMFSCGFFEARRRRHLSASGKTKNRTPSRGRNAVLLDGKNPPTVCGTTRSRCETGANRACYCTRRSDLGQRIMMVPQPEKRPEAVVQIISNLHTSTIGHEWSEGKVDCESNQRALVGPATAVLVGTADGATFWSSAPIAVFKSISRPRFSCSMARCRYCTVASMVSA